MASNDRDRTPEFDPGIFLIFGVIFWLFGVVLFFTVLGAGPNQQSLLCLLVPVAAALAGVVGILWQSEVGAFRLRSGSDIKTYGNIFGNSLWRVPLGVGLTLLIQLPLLPPVYGTGRRFLFIGVLGGLAFAVAWGAIEANLYIAEMERRWGDYFGRQALAERRAISPLIDRHARKFEESALQREIDRKARELQVHNAQVMQAARQLAKEFTMVAEQIIRTHDGVHPGKERELERLHNEFLRRAEDILRRR